MTASHLAGLLRKRGHYTLSPSLLRVMGAIDAVLRAGKRPTLRELAKELGVAGAGSSWLSLQLRYLRAAGLIDFEDARHSTIRFTCTLEIL